MVPKPSRVLYYKSGSPGTDLRSANRELKGVEQAISLPKFTSSEKEG
jgi:hypothetical protein